MSSERMADPQCLPREQRAEANHPYITRSLKVHTGALFISLPNLLSAQLDSPLSPTFVQTGAEKKEGSRPWIYTQGGRRKVRAGEGTCSGDLGDPFATIFKKMWPSLLRLLR
jgi:hypothetical protein